MALETELKLSLSPETAQRLPGHPLLAGIAAQRLQLINTYYDTADRRLQQKRMAVRFRKKDAEWLLTVKCDAASPGGLARRNEWEGAAQPGRFDFSLVDSPKIRRFLESTRRQLRPLFTTDFTRDRWLLTSKSGSRIEVALDQGAIIAGKQQEAICEVELELLDGRVDDLFALARALQNELALHPQGGSKAERGYRLASDSGLLPVGASKAAVEPTAPALAAYRETVFACLAHLQANERGLLSSDSPEFTYQARLALRRLRSVIRLWRPLLPSRYVDNFAPRWRNIAEPLGVTRNWDVFVDDLLPPLLKTFARHATLPALEHLACEQRAAARQASRAMMSTHNYSQLLLEFTQATLTLPERKKPSLLKFAPLCLDKCARSVATLAHITRDADPEARHDLRIALKRLGDAA
ncbi:MAG TPA: CYTH and CHAD domain-containing protein, partial [Accumulibacter sp.]|nr:CYTH and CHAD domain-containing protein [Accumulibacter sp.]